MFNVLVVEDDRNLRKLFSVVLRQNGYNPISAEDGLQALDTLDKEHIDLIICDIMMPNMDGYELTDTLRKANYTLPILMVTAKETFFDKQKGFSAGTDDYMVKPINTDEMILRVGALLRRSQMISEHRLTAGNAILDFNSLTVKWNDNIEELPPKEFYVLFKLLSCPNQIFTRRQLMDEIWGMDADTEERTVDVHIRRLRERFMGCEDFDIVTIRGLGYKAVKR